MAVDVTILKVDNPWRFWLKEAPGPRMSSETKLFQDLTERIQEHCASHLHISKYVLQPEKGQLCLAKRATDKRWYRARIQTIMQSTQGPQASLYLLDFAESIRSPTSWLRELPSEFLKVPLQVKEARLYKTQPLTLETCFVDLSVSSKPCKMWDKAAVVYFKNAVKEATSSKVEVHHHDNSSSIFYVTLYLNMPLEGLIDMNEDLVVKQYAIKNEVGLSSRKCDEKENVSTFQKVDVDGYLMKQFREYEEKKAEKEGELDEIEEKKESRAVSMNIGEKTNDDDSKLVEQIEKLENLKKEEMLRSLSQTLERNVHGQSWGVPDDGMSKSSEDRWSETEATSGRRKQQAIGRGKMIIDMLSKMDGNNLGSQNKKKEELEPVMISRRRVNRLEYQSPKTSTFTFPQELSESDSFSTFSPSPWSKKCPNVSIRDYKNDQETSTDSDTFFYTKSSRKKLTSNENAPDNTEASSMKAMRVQMSPILDSGDDANNTVVKSTQKRTASMAEMITAFALSASDTYTSKDSDSCELSSPDRHRRRRRRNVLEMFEQSPVGLQTQASNGSWKEQSVDSQDSQSVDGSLLGQSLDGQHSHSLGGSLLGQSLDGQHSRSLGGSLFGQSNDGHSHVLDGNFRESSDGHHSQSLDGSLEHIKRVHWKPELIKDSTDGAEEKHMQQKLVGILKSPSPVAKSSKLFEERFKETDFGTPSTLTKEFDKKLIQERLKNQLLAGRLPTKSQQLSEDFTLVHGDRPLKPIVELEEAPFPDMFKRMLKKKNFCSPSLIQSHSWPTILRGRDMVGVSRQNRSHAYLLPLFTQVVQPSAYSALPRGTGPLIIVIVPRWKKAKQVYDDAQSMLPNAKYVRALVIHGAGAEENKEIDLINGCEILVGTPLCFLRLLKKSHLNTERLCHLVFDDADVVFSDFTQEVREIMQEYGKTLQNQPSRSAPRQILAFSSHWTAGLESFMKAYQSDPLVIIAHKLEAAVYGRIRHVVHTCPSSQKYNKVLDLLDTAHAQPADTRIVIFTRYKEDALNLHHLLLSSSHYAMVVHDAMSLDDVEKVCHEWRISHQKDSTPVLVFTDDVEFTLTNATWVIHFDFPTSKGTFGQRLWSCRDSYVNQLQQSSKKCQSLSHMLIGSDDYEHVSGFAQFLKQSRQKLPPKLNVEKAKQDKEERKKTEKLCNKLKALGKCSDERCRFRHLLYAELDNPMVLNGDVTLPVSGYVKVLITYIVDATHYFARVLSSQPDLSSAEMPVESGAVKLSSDLQSWFGNPLHRVKHLDAKRLDMCVIEDSRHTFHRVRVEMLFASHDNTQNATVQLVDNGRFEVVATDNLLGLPAHLYHIPFQVVEVFLCHLRPKDQDTDWTNQASAFVHNLTYHKELCGRVLLSLGNTLWLDPLVERVQLSTIKTVVNEHNVRLELLRAGFADHNPEHMKLLKDCCQGRIDIYYPPSDKEEKDVSTVSTKAMQLSEKYVTEVYLSAIDTPDLIYVQRLDKYKRLEVLMKEINDRMEKEAKNVAPMGRVASVDGAGDCAGDSLSTKEEEAMKKGSTSDDSLRKPGSYCIAKFPLDGMWYRGQIVEKLNSEETIYTVFFLDYGDQEDITESDIHSVWDDVLQLPFQAIECRLTGVLPTEGVWNQDVGNVLWDICNENECKRVLDAKVISKDSSKVNGVERYEVELSFNAATPSSLSCTSSDLSVTLVLQGFALPSDTTLQYMFPTSEESDSVPALCKMYFQIKDENERLYLARNLLDITSNIAKIGETFEPHDVRALCYVCSVATDPSEKQLFIEAIIKASYNSFRNCDEISEHGCLQQVCALLSQSSEDDVIEQVLWILKVVSITKRVRNSLQTLDVVDSLCLLLSGNHQNPVLINCCIILKKLMSSHPENHEMLKQASGIKILCDLLKKKKDDTEMSQAVLSLLSELASNSRYRDDIREFGGLEIMCEFLWNVEDEEILSLSALTLKLLGNANPTNLTAMINEGMLDSIESLLLQPTFSEVTTHLLSELDIQLLEFSFTNKARIDLAQRASLEGVDIKALENEGGVMKQDTKHTVATIPKEMTLKYPGYHEVMSPHYVNNDDNDVDLSGLPPLEVADDIKRTHPKVLWSQKPNSILLSVRLSGVNEKEVVVTKHSVFFSAIIDIVCYEFNLELFGSVLTDNHVVVATGSEVLITLFKDKENVQWPRLTKSKSKLPFVGIDFERWQDDSSSSDESHKEKLVKQYPKPKLKENTSSSKPQMVVLPEFDTSSESSKGSSSSNGGDEFNVLD
ncbi:uncharacterized protein LOC117109479 isoform X2 [Anneissia japonica]|uniref:uncharacterized protein LOC117109479 isoform X1 n=1 Tax=Anneissia japonica TaxID=1529436 RepID=UPI001425A7C5|nr:uncharacterized protein LOC117109479 isoform X1 [Anneissia japonica]XP_033107731.1 uncharacterized protein LOC117109479 isoform X2 [Anneissia japonica]